MGKFELEPKPDMLGMLREEKAKRKKEEKEIQSKGELNESKALEEHKSVNARKGEGRLKNTVRCINPVNLKHNVALFGYDLKVSEALFVYLGMFAVSIIVALTYHISLLSGFMICLASLFVSPYIILAKYEKKYQAGRFEDSCQYMDQMLYSFKEKQQIPAAIEATAELFPKDSEMYACLYESLQYYRTSTDIEVAKNALNIIEEKFFCQRIASMHKLFVKQQNSGGNCSESIKNMLRDKNTWMRNVKKHQMDVKQLFIATCFALVAIVALGVITPYLIMGMIDNIVISEMTVMNVECVLLIFGIYGSFVKILKRTCENWLMQNSSTSAETVKKQYERFVTYDEKKEQKTSLLWSFIGVAVMVAAFIFHSSFVGILGIILFLLLLNQHKIGHHLDRASLVKELQVSFPTWLTEMSLLLQSSNIVNALLETSQTAMPVMKAALDMLIAEIHEKPEDAEPFKNFLAEFRRDIPEIQASMNTLYTMSVGTGGDYSDQIASLIERNSDLNSKADTIKNENSITALQAMFRMPMLLGMVKMGADMVIMMILTFAQAGSL